MTGVFRLVTLVSAMLTFSASALQAAEFAPSVTRRAIFHARQVLKRYPADSHVVVGLGLSVPLIATAMKVFTNDDELFRTYYFEAPVTSLARALARRSDDSRQRVLSRILPAPAVVNGRTIVILRALWLGHSMGQVYAEFYNYVRQVYGGSALASYLISSTWDTEFWHWARLIEGAGKKITVTYDPIYANAYLRQRDNNSESAYAWNEVADYMTLTADEPFQWKANPRRIDLTDEVKTVISDSRGLRTITDACADSAHFVAEVFSGGF